LSEQKNRWVRLSKAAFITAVVHLIAGLCMAIILRQGLDTADLQSRLSFLTEYTTLWIYGWLTWNLAAFAILYFYYCFAESHAENNNYAWLLRFAVLLTVAGMAIDFCAEAIEMGVLPNLAQMILVHTSSVANSSTEIFLALHRTAIMMTGCLSNELYTISAAILIFATWSSYGWIIRGSGFLLVVAGIGLSVACLLNWVTGMFLYNVILLPMLVIWLLAIAYDSWKRAKIV
jgi:hypothetical protein